MAGTGVRPMQVAVPLCPLLDNIVQSTVIQYLYLKPRMFRSKCKSCGDGAATAKKHQLLHCTACFSRYCTIRFEIGEGNGHPLQ